MDFRLKRKSDFNEIFQKGKRAYAKNLTIIYLIKNKFKIGISISKKHGNAVERNRIKRLIRASYIPLLPLIKKKYCIVFLPKTNKNFCFEEINREILYLLKKESLFINE